MHLRADVELDARGQPTVRWWFPAHHVNRIP